MPSDNENANIIYQKAARYCGYQERTEKEVQEKLRAWGTKKAEEVYVIQALKENHFLDEGRYVETFIRSKFLAKKWGKRKILATLRKKELSPALIQEGLAAIENTVYLQSLRYVAEQKKQTLAEVPHKLKKQKLANYLLQKGYEPDLVSQVVQAMLVP